MLIKTLILFFFFVQTNHLSFGQSLDFSKPCVSPTYLEEKNKKYDPNETSAWFNTKSPKIFGNFLVTHGLNLRPSAMNEIIHILNDLGFNVFRLSLRGHRGSSEEMKLLEPNFWYEDFYSAYCEVFFKSQNEKIPTYFLGFSIGTLLAQSMQNLNSNIKFKKQILFAPAFSVPFYTTLLKIFFPFGNDFLIPSFNTTGLRANDKTSVMAYKMLFSMMEENQNSHYKNSNIESLIIMDKRDKLVSFSGTEEIMIENNLTNWQISPITVKNPLGHYHLVVHPKSFDEQTWENIIQKIKTFLFSG